MIKQIPRGMMSWVIGLLVPFAPMAQEWPHLGDPWDPELSGPTQILVFNNWYPRADSMVDSIHFTLAVDALKGGIIKWISTRDTAFTLRGNKIIGLRFGSLKNKSQLQYAPGFAYYVPLDDAWYAGFDFRSPITDTTKVSYAFQYRF